MDHDTEPSPHTPAQLPGVPAWLNMNLVVSDELVGRIAQAKAQATAAMGALAPLLSEVAHISADYHFGMADAGKGTIIDVNGAIGDLLDGLSGYGDLIEVMAEFAGGVLAAAQGEELPAWVKEATQ